MVKVKKLKITESGFKAIDSSYHSDVNAALAAFDWKETNLSESELDAVWDRVNQSAGWDQGYVDSFVNKDESPPQADAQKGDKAMHEWMKHADAYLRALITLEGRGINLPEGWEKVNQSLKFLYALNIALDACFRMKRKDCSSEAADPGLSRGFAYVVEESAFQEYLKKHEKETEPKSTCSRHDAVNLADIRPGQGYTSSGIATVECSRHNAKRPLAVCDMQRGERYCNMDYITILSLQLCLLKLFFISYDIACQWFIHLLLRLSQIDSSSPLLQPDVEIRFLVPKFHLPAHIPACRNRFAFMLTPGAALGDGEAPERGWGELNHLATSTREMGPGTRRDTLDYHFGDYNWRKIVRLGDSLLKKLTTATSDVAEHVIAHQELEATISPDKLRSWTEAMVAWELDPTCPNPYEVTVKTPTQAAVRRQLAEAEEEALAKGVNVSLLDEVSPCSLIAMGIDLEGEQRSLKTLTKSLWDHSQDRQITRVKLRSNALTRKLEEWFSLLQLYIPASIPLRKRELQKKESPKPFEVTLWLPSQIGKSVQFDRSLADIEYKLRNAQAHEALGVLRRNLQIRATLYDIKDRWLRGQGANTRALNALSTVQARIVAARDEYRQAQAALLALADLLGYANVGQEFLPLEDKDIRSMAEAEPGQGETRRKLSWIWRRVNAADATEEETQKFVAESERFLCLVLSSLIDSDVSPYSNPSGMG
ncbi:hypothetical protein H1R20_g6064, partial [Candolleomyces eurysporus]